MEAIKYTCLKCQVEFSTRDLVNAHYSGKWHQYNLMKIHRGLPSSSQKEYIDLMSKTTYLQQEKNRINTIKCAVCKKSFTSQGSHETHQRSKRHKDNIVRNRAETIRRQKTQLKKLAKESGISASTFAASKKLESDDNNGSQYCRECKAAFQFKKDYLKHILTQTHKKCVKAFKLAAERQAELDRQDAEDATADCDQMQVVIGEAADDGEWEDLSADEDSDSDAETSQGDPNKHVEAKQIPTNVCLFCHKRSGNLTDNLSHMERQHCFIVPHRQSADLEALFTYLGNKIGVGHQCIECKRQFDSVKACRRHLLDKPHLAIRFEGEYDQFFALEKIMARLVLPARPKENDIFAFPMPDGSVLTHRDLRCYFKQRLPVQRSAQGLKRLTRGSGFLAADSHLGKALPGKSLIAIKKDNQKIARTLKAAIYKQDKTRLGVAVKANKLQPHLRPQVINAG